MKRIVLVTQPYLPSYRIPLFGQIEANLSKANLRLVVAAGAPRGAQAMRGDAETAPWSIRTRDAKLRVGSREIKFRQVPSDIKPAVVVSELEALNTFAWAHLLGSSRRVPLVLWGHGKPFVNKSPLFAEKIEWSLARRAAAIMTYSEEGRDYITAKAGLPRSRVTAIGNSTDTARLRSLYLQELRASNRPRAGMQALYVGGLDADKRIEFLLEAASHAHAIDPAFKLTVVGDGELASQVERASLENPFVTYLGKRGPNDIAKLGAAVDVMWVPGRVGLVAVDSLAMGLPVHTTNFAYHAPERGFLRESEVETLEDTPAHFARQSVNLLRSYSSPSARSLRDDIPTIESVAREFTRVVLRSLETR